MRSVLFPSARLARPVTGLLAVPQVSDLAERVAVTTYHPANTSTRPLPKAMRIFLRSAAMGSCEKM